MNGRLLSFLGSLKATITLIIALSTIFLLGLWIPQKTLLQKEIYLRWKSASPGVVSFLETIGFTDIYMSPVTLTLWVFFFINLSLVMWRRIAAVRSITSISSFKLNDPSDPQAYPARTSLALSKRVDMDALRAQLEQERYSYYGENDRFYAVKNRRSPYATLLFHLSFFLILAGGIVSVYTKFEGMVDIAEGERFNGKVDMYNPSPRLPKAGSMPHADFVVEKIEPETTEGAPTGIKVTIRDASGKTSVAEVNRPFRSGGTSFVIKDLGVAPLFVVLDDKGRELDGAYVKLNVLNGKEESFPLSTLDISARFFPDYVLREGKEESRSPEFKNPAFLLYVQEHKRYLASKTLRPGESMNVGKYRLNFPELRFWVRLYVVKEHGTEIVFAGFLVATIALIWRLLFYRREIIGRRVAGPQGDELHLAGRAEFYRALFEDEFLALAGRLFDRLRKSQ